MATRAKPIVEVTRTAGLMGGMPCVSGTRVPAETILDSINHGMTDFDIYSGYPYLPLGSIEAVKRCAVSEGRPCSNC